MLLPTIRRWRSRLIHMHCMSTVLKGRVEDGRDYRWSTLHLPSLSLVPFRPISLPAKGLFVHVLGTSLFSSRAPNNYIQSALFPASTKGTDTRTAVSHPLVAFRSRSIFLPRPHDALWTNPRWLREARTSSTHVFGLILDYKVGRLKMGFDYER